MVKPKRILNCTVISCHTDGSVQYCHSCLCSSPPKIATCGSQGSVTLGTCFPIAGDLFGRCRIWATSSRRNLVLWKNWRRLRCALCWPKSATYHLPFPPATAYNNWQWGRKECTFCNKYSGIWNSCMAPIRNIFFFFYGNMVTEILNLWNSHVVTFRFFFFCPLRINLFWFTLLRITGETFGNYSS